MISPSKKLLSLFLIFSLVMLSANLYAKERRGAKLIITKKDGQLIKGELIVVKLNSLLLLDTDGKDMSVDIPDIKVIKIVKKSKIWTGARLGFKIGGSVGALGGFFDYLNEELWLLWLATFVGGIIGASIGFLIGGIVGAAVGDETIRLEAMSDSEIQETLDKLRKKARIRDYK